MNTITRNEMIIIVSTYPEKTLATEREASMKAIREHPGGLGAAMQAMLMIVDATAFFAAGMRDKLMAMPEDAEFDLDSGKAFLQMKPDERQTEGLAAIAIRYSNGMPSAKVGAHLIVDAVGLMVKEFEDAMVALAATKATADV